MKTELLVKTDMVLSWIELETLLGFDLDDVLRPEEPTHDGIWIQENPDSDYWIFWEYVEE